ncbi:hypothetical protein [Maricaulis maris]|uniref:hypothetical protein n=1 Tax=Maricaulis maris TaxID=74318 RepID=UPI003A8F56F1
MLDWFRGQAVWAVKFLKGIVRWRPVGLTANVALWRSWEQSSRAVGLGALGLSLFAESGVVRPGFLAMGSALIVVSWVCAFYLGQMEAET